MAKITVEYVDKEIKEKITELYEENAELKRQVKQLKKALEETVKYAQKKIYWE